LRRLDHVLHTKRAFTGRHCRRIISIHLSPSFGKRGVDTRSNDVALLIPSRPAHIADLFFKFQRRHGRVLWWSGSRIARCFEVPITGYIYQEGRIRYRVKVAQVLDSPPEWAESAVPKGYRARLRSQLRQSRSFLEIVAFERLESPLSLSDFVTASRKEIRAAPRRTIYVLTKARLQIHRILGTPR